jgi:tetratricopeptide (TPR) repeat protein
MSCALMGRSVSVFALIGAALVSAQISDWQQKYDQGISALNEGRNADGRAILQAAYDAAQSLDDRVRARAAGGLASAFLQEGHLEEAERYYNEARAILEPSGGPAIQLAIVWTGLGEIFLDRLRLDEGEKALRRAMSLLKDTPQVHPCALLCRRHFAELLFLRGDYAAAETLLKELVADARKSGSPMLGITLSVLGRTYIMQKRLADAEPAIKESMDLQRQSGEQSPAYADILVLMAGEYRLEGRMERAAPLVRKALKIYEDFHDPRAVFAYRELAMEAATEGKYLMARGHIEKALDIARKASMPERVTETLEQDLSGVPPVVASSRRK